MFKGLVEEGQDQIELRLLSEAKSRFDSIYYPAGVDVCEKLEEEYKHEKARVNDP